LKIVSAMATFLTKTTDIYLIKRIEPYENLALMNMRDDMDRREKKAVTLMMTRVASYISKAAVMAVIVVKIRGTEIDIRETATLTR
jgi:hypothetical protein